MIVFDLRCSGGHVFEAWFGSSAAYEEQRAAARVLGVAEVVFLGYPDGLLEPTLETWGVPYYRLDQEDQLPNIRVAYEKAYEIRGPSALIVGAPTR